MSNNDILSQQPAVEHSSAQHSLQNKYSHLSKEDLIGLLQNAMPHANWVWCGSAMNLNSSKR